MPCPRPWLRSMWPCAIGVETLPCVGPSIGGCAGTCGRVTWPLPNKVEQEFSLAQVEFDAGQIVEVETFLALERALQRHVEQSLLESPTEGLAGTWPSPDCPASGPTWCRPSRPDGRWWPLPPRCCWRRTGRQGPEEGPGHRPGAGQSLCRRRHAWCLLDTHHRHMESRWYNFEPELGEQHDGLDKLIPRPSSDTPRSVPNWPSISSRSSRRPSTRSRVCCGRSRSSSTR